MIIIKKKILLILAVILMGFGTLYRPALADSGWDSDYDSGGSWDSGSDWDSSSSWDSGSDWDSSSSWSSGGSSISGSGGGISLVAVIIVVVIIVVVVSKNGGNKGGGSSNISNSINGSNNISNYKDIDSEKIKSIDKDLNAVQVAIFSIYLTLLDYLDPPAIAEFKFPCLINENFFESDFFNEETEFNILFKDIKFDFIVGNPPWKGGGIGDLGSKYLKNRKK